MNRSFYEVSEDLMMVGKDSSRQHRKQAPLGLHFKKFIIVLTAKVDVKFEEEDAVAKVIKVKE